MKLDKYKMAEKSASKKLQRLSKAADSLNDPRLIAALAVKMTEERQSMTLLLKEINAKLERLDDLERKFSSKPQVKGKMLLPEVDEKILSFMKKNGRKCHAGELQAHLKYKGKNAASSRLNKLVSKGIMTKQQVGRKVYFLLNEDYAS